MHAHAPRNKMQPLAHVRDETFTFVNNYGKQLVARGVVARLPQYRNGSQSMLVNA